MSTQTAKKILKLAVIISSIVLATPNISFAQLNDGFSNVDNIAGNVGAKKFNTANEFIIEVLKVGLSIMGLVAAAVIIYGGYLYVTSFGDEKKAEQGKHAILYAVIGLIIIGGAAILANVVVSIFKK